jgi:hypothetical protein
LKEGLQRLGQPGRRTNEDQDATVLIWESVLSEEILVMRDEEERPRSSVNLLVRGITTKAVFPLGFSDLPEPCKRA